MILFQRLTHGLVLNISSDKKLSTSHVILFLWRTLLIGGNFFLCIEKIFVHSSYFTSNLPSLGEPFTYLIKVILFFPNLSTLKLFGFIKPSLINHNQDTHKEPFSQINILPLVLSDTHCRHALPIFNTLCITYDHPVPHCYFVHTLLRRSMGFNNFVKWELKYP